MAFWLPLVVVLAQGMRVSTSYGPVRLFDRECALCHSSMSFCVSDASGVSDVPAVCPGPPVGGPPSLPPGPPLDRQAQGRPLRPPRSPPGTLPRGPPASRLACRLASSHVELFVAPVPMLDRVSYASR